MSLVFAHYQVIMQIIRLLIQGIDWVNEKVGRLTAWLTVIMVLNVFFVVLLRYVFGVGWVWMQELYVWSHATAFMAGAGYTFLHNGHVRIDLIYRAASPRYKAIVDILGGIFLALPLLIILYLRGLPIFIRSWEVSEKSAEAGGLPALYLLKLLILVFCILLGIQVLAQVLRNILLLLGMKTPPTPEDRETGSVVDGV